MRYKLTYEAAQRELVSEWELIEAIAEDAVENEVPITGIDSVLAAREALADAGRELADATVKTYCLIAKYDYEALAKERRVFQRYTPTLVGEFAKAGWEHAKATAFLMGDHKTSRQVREKLYGRKPRSGATDAPTPRDLGQAWIAWARDMNRVMMRGTELAARLDAEQVELDGEAAYAYVIYERITERKIDAELRELFERQGADEQ